MLAAYRRDDNGRSPLRADFVTVYRVASRRFPRLSWKPERKGTSDRTPADSAKPREGDRQLRSGGLATLPAPLMAARKEGKVTEHLPTAQSRAKVIGLACNAIRQDRIAKHLAIDPKTLRKHYHDELTFGMEAVGAPAPRPASACDSPWGLGHRL